MAMKMVELKTIYELEDVISEAVRYESFLGLFISMPGFEEPELIVNPHVNLERKLAYYKKTYNEKLEHNHAPGIKIIGYEM